MAPVATKIWQGPDTLKKSLRAIAELEPWPDNPRLGDIASIAQSLRRFGQVYPIVVKGSRIVKGHHVVEAARSLGWTHVAVLDHDFGDNEDEARAFLLTDNRTSELGSFDTALLVAQLEAVQQLEGTGYSPDDLDDLRVLLAAQERAQNPRNPDDTPPIPAKPKSQPGEIYELGPHRLMCGDCTNEEQVLALLDGNQPKLCVTDPPYGVNYDPAWRQEEAEKGHLSYAARRVGQVVNDDRFEWTPAWMLVPSDVIYVWHAVIHACVVQAGLASAGFDVRSQIVWAKPHFPISRGHYHWRHETAWYAVRRGRTGNWIGDRTQTSLWEVTLDANVEGGHSTQKPVELTLRPLRNHEGDLYEPFAGSGSAVIAAEMMGRRCFAMEIDPGYCDVVRQRYADYVQRPELAPSE